VDGEPAVTDANDRVVTVPAAPAPGGLRVTGLESAPLVTPQAGPTAKASACPQH